MCGRITLASKVSALHDLIDFDFELMPDDPPARFNIAPTQPVLAFRMQADNARPVPALLQWGLVPFWADDVKIGSRMINARSETVAEKPAFRAALKYRRCLIPIDGFYEWQTSAESRLKTPFWIHRPDRRPFALAGLWETWDKGGQGPLETCTILTTHANGMMGRLHDRMPVIIPPSDFERWLKTDPSEAGGLKDLFAPAPDNYLEAWPVGRAVNSPAQQGPQLAEPVQGTLF